MAFDRYALSTFGLILAAVVLSLVGG